jgi:hypothetical protein
MKRHLSHCAAVSLLAGLLALGACDQGKPRHLPDDPMAAMPPQPVVAQTPPPSEGAAAGLIKRKEAPGFFVDHIGAATDPRSKTPAVTPAGQSILIDGFAFDDVTKVPGRAVDVVVDGRVFTTVYGAPRQDVATYFKTPALVNVGFKTTLPAETLTAGPHILIVRVVGPGGKGFFESAKVPFAIQ